MTRQFSLPDLGEGVKEGRVLRLLVDEGERVVEDQHLCEVETDKAAVEIPSPFTGTVAKWHVAEQQVVNVGDVMVTFGDADSTVPAAAAPVAAAPVARAATAAIAAPAPPGAPAGTGTVSRRVAASPAVRKMARTLGIDLTSVEGSGPGGRVLRADVERASVSPAARGPAPASVPAPTPSLPPPPPAAPAAPVVPPGTPDTDPHGPIVRETITQTRRAIATVMSHSMSTIPHVTDSDDADVTDLDVLRRGYNASLGDAVAPERRLGMLAFVVRAVARALQLHPIFNASFDEGRGEIVYKRYYHIAVGVQTERGLVAPVLRNVEAKSVPQINDELAALIDKARHGRFALDDTLGATYTISNAGAMGGSRYSTPIITPPQVAVLAVGRSRRRPWMVGTEILPRLVMPLSHSMDHRIIDGALEIAFMKQVIGDLENPGRLLL